MYVASEKHRVAPQRVAMSSSNYSLQALSSTDDTTNATALPDDDSMIRVINPEAESTSAESDQPVACNFAL